MKLFITTILLAFLSVLALAAEKPKEQIVSMSVCSFQVPLSRDWTVANDQLDRQLSKRDTSCGLRRSEGCDRKSSKFSASTTFFSCLASTLTDFCAGR